MNVYRAAASSAATLALFRKSALGAAAIVSIGLALVSPANAMTVFTYGNNTGVGTDPGYGSQTSVVNFETPTVAVSPSINGPSTGAGYTEVDSGTVGIFNQTTGIAASPAGDTSQFEAIGTGGTATFSFDSSAIFGHAAPITSLSVYLGSIDTYNYVTIVDSLGTKTMTGPQLIASDFGDQSAGITNRRLFVNDLAGIQSITFGSTGVAFEYDNIAVGESMVTAPGGAVFAAVPEPATWTMLLLGFFGVGYLVRSTRRKDELALA